MTPSEANIALKKSMQTLRSAVNMLERNGFARDTPEHLLPPEIAAERNEAVRRFMAEMPTLEQVQAVLAALPPN